MSQNTLPLSANNIIDDLGLAAKQAAGALARAPGETINKVLADLADLIRDHTEDILAANRQDLSGSRASSLTEAMKDRLRLTPERIAAIASSVESIMALDDPAGKVLKSWERPNGLQIQKVSVPIGVFGMIYESRPNVTIDAAALCLKSHNAVILRGGSECLNSSLALHELVQKALTQNGLPAASVGMVPVADRAAVSAMLQAKNTIDVIIPRGGKGLVEKVMNESLMPVFAHLEGICHSFVHASADINMAKEVVVNAKMRRTGICGATETLLLDSALSPIDMLEIITALQQAGCDVIGSPEVQKLDASIGKAGDSDWTTEYLDAKISVKTVQGVEGAVEHINHFGSHHTDSIIAADQMAADYFLANVDSGIVMHNASTQFADGGEFGMGAEIGIATGKLHARGPVGVEQLTTYKYQLRGNGQTRPK
jgi:glutamate-5-semialdehyde dehydrogenase